MNKSYRKAMSFFLVIALFIGLMPVTASSNQEITSDTETYTYQKSEAENLLTQSMNKSHAFSPFDNRDAKKTAREDAEYNKNVIIYERTFSSDTRLFNMNGSGVDSALAQIGAVNIEEVIMDDTSSDGKMMSLAGTVKTVYRAEISADVWEAVNTLLAFDEITYAEPEYLYHTAESGLPGTTDTANQWYIDNGPFRTAWEYTKANGDGVKAPGEGSVVAVIDTGVDYNHPDLISNMWINSGEIPGNNTDDDGNGYTDDYHGYNFIANNGDPMDDHGHGTHIAGIIGMGDNGYGGVGAAYGAQIMAIKAGQSTGVFSSTDIAKAINYAKTMCADVINMSFGGYSTSALIENALQSAFSSCVLVAAAGNDGIPTSDAPAEFMKKGDMYPAAYTYVIGVMATDNTGNLAGFSNWDYYNNANAEYELTAPGANIYSALPGGRYASWDGTSMAAPMVAAAAAVLRGYYPDKSIYSSRFIMGQLTSATEDSTYYIDKIDELHMYAALDLTDSLSKLPKPNLKVTEVFALDTVGLNALNDGDGIADTGEIIDLGLTVRNQWGAAKNVTVSIDAISDGGVANPYITLITDTISLGTVGTFSSVNNGYVYNDGYLENVTIPLRFKISDSCPNDANIAINITVTANNGWDAADTMTYTATDLFSIWVQRGRALKGEISADTTLSKDYYWIIESGVLIKEGVTLTVEPGTQIQFWSSDYEDAYGSMTMAYINNMGTLNMIGTEEEPIEMFPGKNFESFCVNIYGDGVETLTYCNIINPILGLYLGLYSTTYKMMEYCDHLYLIQKTNDIYYRFIYEGNIREDKYKNNSCRIFTLKNSVVSGFNFYGSSFQMNFETDYSENVLFENCSIKLHGKVEDCVFLGNHNKYYNGDNINFIINEFSGIPIENPTYSDIYTYDRADSKYVFMDFGSYPIKRLLADSVAASVGGMICSINNITEENFLFDTLYNRTEETRTEGNNATIYGYTYLGYTYDIESGSYVWLDGNNYSMLTYSNLPGLSSPYCYAQVYSNLTDHSNVINAYSNSYENFPYLLEFPATIDDSTIKSALANFDYTSFKKNFYKPYTTNCAVLNPILDTDTSKWMSFTAPNYDGEYTYNLAGNYWGTENSDLINLMIKDADDYAGTLADIDETPILTHDSPEFESIYPFVTDIWLEDDDGNVIDSTSYQTVNVHVTYNRDMDTSVQPTVTYGPVEPYTDFTVNGNWISSREWVGTATITAFTGDGTQYFRAAGGCAADDSWLVCGKDTMRFDFTVVSTGAESLNLNGIASESGLKLYWNQDEYDTLAGFNIYRSTAEDGTYTKLNSTLLSSSLREYTDTDVTPGTTYYYYFTVVNTDFTESRASNIVSLTAFDNIAPVLSHTPVTTVKSGQACSFTAAASDNISVGSVILYYRETGKTSYTALEMSATGTGSNYFASIPANEITAAGIQYYIEATDGTSIARSGSPAVPYVITVDLSPALYSVSPYYLSVVGGETATVNGLNFTEGMTVKLDGTAVDYIYVSSTKFTFVTPAKSMGRYDLEISGVNGTAKLLNAVSYTDSASEGQIASATAVAGGTTKIPIYATTSSGISSVELYVKLNTALFSSVVFEKAEGTSGFSFSYNNLGSGVYKLAMASSEVYTAGGAIAYLTVIPGSTDMTVSTQAELQSLIINGTEVDSTVNGEITIKPAFTLTGNISYAGTATPVNNVIVTISGGPGGTSDANGNYTVSNITSANVTYSAAKSGDAGDYAVSSLDASYVLQYCVESLGLSAIQLLAADVDRDGDADAQDASFILQKAVGKISGSFPGSDREWAFEPPFKNTTLTSVATTQNFTAVLLGDVSGNWVNSNEETSSMSAHVGEPMTAIQSGTSSVTYPLSVNINDAYGIDIIIGLGDGIESVDIVEASVLDSASVVYYVSGNELKISIASTGPITLSGELLRMLLTPEVSKTLNSPPCSVTRMLINENEVLLDDGILNHDIVFNFQGVAIKLIEPWGLRFYTQVSGQDFNTGLPFGTIVLHQNYYTSGMTAEEMMTNPNAIVLTSESGDSVLDSGRIVGTMVGGIYTYSMNTSYYTASYVVINGEYIFSSVNSRNIYDRVVYLKDNSTNNYEKAIYQEMYNLYTDVKTYHDSLGTVTIPEPQTIKRGSKCSAGTVGADSGLVAYIFKGVSIRLIEPWGLCFYTEMTTTGIDSVTEFGTVVLSEDDYTAGMTGEEIRLSENSYVFNSTDGTAVYDASHRIVAKLVDGIYTYNMDKMFYTVSYAVIDGEYYYSEVNSRCMYDRVSLLKDTSSNLYEKDIYASMYSLYGAVDAYHRFLGLK